MRIEIKNSDNEIEAEEILHKKITKFNKNSGHIIVPKKWVGNNVTIIIEELTGNAMSGWGRKWKKEQEE